MVKEKETAMAREMATEMGMGMEKVWQMAEEW